jgi:hypothetical protein
METIQSIRSRHGLLASFHVAYVVGAGVALVAVVCATFLRPTRTWDHSSL